MDRFALHCWQLVDKTEVCSCFGPVGSPAYYLLSSQMHDRIVIPSLCLYSFIDLGRVTGLVAFSKYKLTTCPRLLHVNQVTQPRSETGPPDPETDALTNRPSCNMYMKVQKL